MSEDTNNTNTTSCCASCGIAEIDGIKLKECGGCNFVRYCSDECQRDHKPEHEDTCKKRAAELREELLFKQPESTHLGDCPICYLPMPLDETKSTMMSCCSKIICNGCSVANMIREIEGSLNPTCPFCREPFPETEEDFDKLTMKRIKMNDPVAMWEKGTKQYIERDYTSALEWFTKSAELGDVVGHFKLAALYHDGRGVEQDRGKEIHHLEEAAIGGHPDARHHLGWHEKNNDNTSRAVKHLIISATQGYDDSMNLMMEMFKGGCVSKEVLAVTLRAHQAAVEATKSPQRELAEDFKRFKNERGYD